MSASCASTAWPYQAAGYLMRRPESVATPTRASGAPTTANHLGDRLAVLLPFA
jgi:hypothetical protein